MIVFFCTAPAINKTSKFDIAYRLQAISYKLIVDIRLLASPADYDSYHRWIASHPQSTLWQSLEWKEYQESLGRATRLYAATENDRIIASALVVIDRTSFGLSAWDIPRGPVGDGAELLETIVADAKKDGCLALTYSPIRSIAIKGSIASPRHEQPEATRIVDISKDDETILARMHQKGRYNIKVAQKNGITVRLSREIQAYYDLMKQTGERDRFGIKPLKHYKAFLEHLSGTFLLLAYKDETPVAGLLGCVHGTTGIYYYGASSYEHRALMAPYLLQWEAMQYCRKQGCLSYDLLGVAPEGSGADHPWAGISSFKEKFGGAFVSYQQERQIVLKPLASKLIQLKRKILG